VLQESLILKKNFTMQQSLLSFFAKKKMEETQLKHLVWAEASSVSISFRFLAMKMIHYPSSPIDTFIGWKTHLLIFQNIQGWGMPLDSPSGMGPSAPYLLVDSHSQNPG